LPRRVEPQLWTEAPVERLAPVALVAPVSALDKLYTYAIPPHLEDAVRPGIRITVPFGARGRPRTGFCVAVSREPWTTTLKPVLSVVDEAPLLSPPLLELGRWISEYYCAPLGRALEAMVPAPVRRQSGFRTVQFLRLTQAGWALAAEAAPQTPTAGAAMSAAHTSTGAKSCDIRLTARRRAILEWLRQAGGRAEWNQLRAAALASPAAVRALADAGLIERCVTKEPGPAPLFDRPSQEPAFDLNPDQLAAVERIVSWLDPPTFRVGVLFGVSGSGKTEVYVRAIRRAVAAGRQAILLVPEIALTTQTTQRLAARLPDVVVLHSGLTSAQRSLIWSEIARGRRRVVIGTRSAVFAPCTSLGLIVVDEEQEPSFKNQQSPRFHTRDVAIKRAQIEGIPVVLGSATPSLETWANCGRLEHYECLRLPRRVSDLPMPKIEVVDMRVEQRARRGVHLLSRRMEQVLAETLEQGEQAVLLLNRRGYASFLVCPKCRQEIVCPNCQANLIFHKSTGLARCHYCSAKIPVPSHCPNENCRHTLVRFGMGTQRVEEELAYKFPKARIERVDSDTMRRADQYGRIIARFERREIDVLVGTQMIAKGLDFPFVSFVGVVSADTALAIPDFRAAERTFQLVTQVAGRAGRARTAGRVVVQTFATDTHALRYAVTHDYERFAEAEMARRARLRVPPCGRLVRLILADPRTTRLRDAADALAEWIRQTASKHGLAVEVWGPNVCPLARIRNLYRYEILLRADSAALLSAAMQRFRHEPSFRPKVRQFLIDVDPVELL